MPHPIQANDLHVRPTLVWEDIRTRAEHDASPSENYADTQPRFPHRLDPFQAEAASHFTGPMRVLAPAGSGKTRTLTARIAALRSRGVPAGNILALAFNAKAAEEMQTRLNEMALTGIETRTFHSLGYEIVREAYGWQYKEENETLIEQLSRKQLEEVLHLPEHPGEVRRLLENGEKLLREAKSGLIPFDQLHLNDGMHVQDISRAFRALLDAQIRRELLNFSDMIYFALRALLENPALCRRRQRLYTFILVDEFQDLNPAQMFFLRILALPQNNLFVVGDDDQLIYAWRGADVRHILDFSDFYPQAGSIVLATNYRSGSRIVRHGRWLIENNPARVAKDIRPASGAAHGRLELLLAQTPALQAQAAVAWMVQRREEDGEPWEHFGLLVRTNRDAAWLSAAMEEASIPFTLAGPPEPDQGDPPPETTRGKVTLMTVHKSKGKEFPLVIVFNLSRRGGTAQSEADERRVAYVGMTRARDHLLITADAERPSHFIKEALLNPAFSDFADPYLLRKFVYACRREYLHQNCIRSWLISLFRPPTPTSVDLALLDAPRVERYATELQFRNQLRIEIKP